MTTRSLVRSLRRRAPLAVAAGLCLVASAPGQTCADHGIPVNGYPSWQERATLVLTNACRIAPTNFRDTYLGVPTILQPSVYPAVPPLQWCLPLSESSRAHSTDEAVNVGCPFQHNSCDGTAWSTRVLSYDPNVVALGENAAAGFADPVSTLTGLLLDYTSTAPAADASGYDGHRANIMSASYTQVGCGYASGPNYYLRYWTQDFARPSAAAPVCSPVAAGSH
ncbi:MAG: CAP domain-containing protein, partial [Jatrophihabitantaceae bacterium]